METMKMVTKENFSHVYIVKRPHTRLGVVGLGLTLCVELAIKKGMWKRSTNTSNKKSRKLK